MSQLENLDKVLIKDILQDKTGMGEKIFFMSISRHWKEIFGNLADKISPIKISEKTLFLYTNNPTLRDSLKFKSDDVANKVNEIVGHGEKIIEKISFGQSFEKPKVFFHDKKEITEENKFCKEKIILTDEEIAECKKKASGKIELEEIFIERAKLKKFRLANGWRKCKICGELCEPGRSICDICKIYEREKMRKKIYFIFRDEPYINFNKVLEKILNEMPHMKSECNLGVIESAWADLVRDTAARVKFGDTKSKDARFLIMLFKHVREENLTDAIIDKAVKELRFNFAEQPPLIGDKKMFCENLKELSAEINIELDENRLRQFEIFYNLVIDWNKKINLTAITDPQEFILKHLIDSLTLWDNEKFSKVRKIIDVGTGAGFPGIPIKIFKPDVEIVLLDSLNKRVDFLKTVVNELDLKNVTCLHGRAEDFAHDKNFREKFDLATVRAVAGLNIISEYCLPFVKVGGIFAAMKGKQFREEIQSAESVVKILGGDKINFSEKKLPTLSDIRAVIYVKKKFPTPQKYPRNAGIPAKNPL